MNRLAFAGALGALLSLPALGLAQPAAPIMKTVTGRLWIQQGSQGVHLTVNRSETYALSFPIGNPWERLVRHSVDQEVEARIRVISPGPFGGTAMVVGLAKDVKGRVIAAMDGGPVNISLNKSESYQIEGAFQGYLLRRADQEVEARVRITEPGMFGGKAEVVCVYRDVKGQVFAAADGGPVTISANKSNGFQIRNEPFAGLLLRDEGKFVSARLRLVEPGMFGGAAEVIHLDGKTTRNRMLRQLQGSSLISLAFVPRGTALKVTGVSRERPNYLEVELADGSRGLLAKNSVRTGESSLPGVGITAALAPNQ